MPHPSEALLLAFADDALDADAHRETAAHLAACEACRLALRELREAMAALKVEVALVDTREPDAWHAGGSWRAPSASPVSSTSGDPGRLPASARPLAPVGREVPLARGHGTARRGWWGSTSVAMRRAAVALLVVGGGAAAMTAPRWRHLLVGEKSVASAPAIAAPGSAPAATAALPAPSAAVSILPVDGEAIVSLLETSSSAAAMAATAAAAPTPARVVVRVSDRRDVQVTVTSTSRPAARDRVPRFLTGDGKLEVQLAGEGDVVEVEFPSTLRAARVTHDGRTVVSVHGATVLPAEAAGAGILLTQER